MVMFYGIARDGTIHNIEEPMGSMTLAYDTNLDRANAEMLADKLNLPLHIITDVFDANELPRIEVRDGIRYVFLRHPECIRGKIRSQPVLLVVGKKLFASLMARGTLVDELKEPKASGERVSPESLLVQSAMAIVKQYENYIDKVGSHISHIEQRMRSHEATNDDFFDFVTIESNLNRATMSLTGITAVVERLIELEVDTNLRDTLDDVRLFTQQLLVEIASHAQAIASIQNTFSTVSNNILNQRMKWLTFLTLLVALPNVFYGMYGMNIKLPFMHEEWAYLAIVGFTVLLLLVVSMVAKRLKFF